MADDWTVGILCGHPRLGKHSSRITALWKQRARISDLRRGIVAGIDVRYGIWPWIRAEKEPELMAPEVFVHLQVFLCFSDKGKSESSTWRSKHVPTFCRRSGLKGDELDDGDVSPFLCRRSQEEKSCARRRLHSRKRKSLQTCQVREKRSD